MTSLYDAHMFIDRSEAAVKINDLDKAIEFSLKASDIFLHVKFFSIYSIHTFVHNCICICIHIHIFDIYVYVNLASLLMCYIHITS